MLKNSPQRLAWITVLGAFAVFCVLCIGSGLMVRWILLELPMDMEVRVHVSRGTIGLASARENNEIVVRSSFDVGTDDYVRTDSQSQGNLTFRDPGNDNQVLATVQVRENSQVQLKRATRPRFGFGDKPYTIELDEAIGTLEVHIAPDRERDLNMQIIGAGEHQTIRFNRSGMYLLTFNTETVTVTVRYGEALLLLSGERTKLVSEGETATASTSTILAVDEGEENVLENSLFRTGQEEIVQVWGCDREGSGQDNPDDPPARRSREFFQGRYTLHIWRISDELVREARMGCEQRNIDVSDYNSLRLRASFYLVSQSLSGCGQIGTECPLILLINYYDADGNYYQWIQGFYIYWTPGVGRIRCSTCSQDHQQINAEAWYTFESEDFILDLPVDRQDQRPVQIEQIRFYSSGHEYEVYVSEMALLGEPG